MGRVWEKSLRQGIPVPNLASIYAGMTMGMGMVLRAEMGTVKQSPARPGPIVISTYNLIHHIDDRLMHLVVMSNELLLPA